MTAQRNAQKAECHPYIAELWESGHPGFVALSTTIAFEREHRTPPAVVAELLKNEVPECQTARRFVFANQVHGATVDAVDEHEHLIAPQCDGLMTARVGTFLVIRTADCLPVVIMDRKARRCACIHAGWRGSFANIVGSAIRLMKGHGSHPEDLKVWIGPGISGSAYEVSEDLIEQFTAEHHHLGSFTSGRYLDLPRLNSLQAITEGISSQSIYLSNRCTFSESEIFFSHRRQGKNRGHVYTVCGFVE